MAYRSSFGLDFSFTLYYYNKIDEMLTSFIMNIHSEYILLLLPWFAWSRQGHRAATPTLHRTHDLFRSLHSISTVRLHVWQGFPFRHPIPSRGFYCIACRANEDSSFRRVCPIQPHLCLLMITSICYISAIFSRFTSYIVLGQ